MFGNNYGIIYDIQSKFNYLNKSLNFLFFICMSLKKLKPQKREIKVVVKVGWAGLNYPRWSINGKNRSKEEKLHSGLGFTLLFTLPFIYGKSIQLIKIHVLELLNGGIIKNVVEKVSSEIKNLIMALAFR